MLWAGTAPSLPLDSPCSALRREGQRQVLRQQGLAGFPSCFLARTATSPWVSGPIVASWHCPLPHRAPLLPTAALSAWEPSWGSHSCGHQSPQGGASGWGRILHSPRGQPDIPMQGALLGAARGRGGRPCLPPYLRGNGSQGSKAGESLPLPPHPCMMWCTATLTSRCCWQRAAAFRAGRLASGWLLAELPAAQT